MQKLFLKIFIHIKQEGDEVIFTSNRGAEWGRVQLPTVIMTPRGLWQKDTYYGKNDIVGTDKAAYICLKSHMSHDFYREHDHWLTLFTFPSSTTTAIPLESFKLPTMTQDSMLSPIFGMLALYVDEQRPQLLIGDMENWRRVSDNHIVNPDQES